MSQKSTGKFKITVSEQDLFTFYLQKNLWAKGISYEQFLQTMSNNLNIIDDENLQQRLQHCCPVCGNSIDETEQSSILCYDC